MRTQRVVSVVAAVTCLVLTGLAAPVARASGAGDDVRLAPVVSAPGAPLEDRYVVVLRADPAGEGVATGGSAAAAADTRAQAAAAPALDRARSLGVRVDRRYRNAINGFSAELTPEQLSQMRSDPDVAYIARDGIAHGAATQSPTPSWGLDRIDQSALPLDDTFTFGATGSGVTAYIIDSGVRSTHREFGQRVSSGYAGIDDGYGTQDCHGHGTHVAGILGGETFGVARSVDLVSVRVLDCENNGPWSTIIAGIDWVTANHRGPSIANLSVGGDVYQPVDDAVQRSVDSGVTYVIAAMNEGIDACTQSPARVPAALTVGATTKTDTRAGYSDYGRCVDIFAPGSAITSAANSGDDKSGLLSGTSMAAPHVAGVAVLYLESHPTATPAEVAAQVLQDATSGVVKDPGEGSPNLLLRSNL